MPYHAKELRHLETCEVNASVIIQIEVELCQCKQNTTCIFSSLESHFCHWGPQKFQNSYMVIRFWGNTNRKNELLQKKTEQTQMLKKGPDAAKMFCSEFWYYHLGTRWQKRTPC